MRLIVAMLVLIAPLSLMAQPALERVRHSGQLRVGMDATYPPFGSVEGAEFSGFDVDLGRAIARELGVDPVFINAGFDGIFPALQNGTFDLVISAARTGQELASRYAVPLTIWPMVAVLYLLLTFPLTRMAEYLERRWRPVKRA